MELMKNNTGQENVSEIERWASLIGGSALVLYGLKRRSLGSLALAALGGSFVLRGTTGQCYIYKALGMDTSGQGEPYGRGVKLRKSVTINKSLEELYRFWRNFENLPQFMAHLESVKVIDDKRSHWVAKAPAGKTVEWDAEITIDRENEMIGWRSLEGAEVDNAGSVRFEKATGGRGTTVRVALQYNPPGGKVGAAVAKLFGEEPEQQIQEDLYRFKQLIETGEIATAETQSSSNNIGDKSTEDHLRQSSGTKRKKDVVQKASEDSFPASDAPAWTSRREVSQ